MTTEDAAARVGSDLVATARSFVRRNGPVLATRKVLSFARSRAMARIGIHDDPVEQRRLEISRQLIARYGKSVLHGPFAGLALNDRSSWSAGDFAAMMFGLYEKEVVDHLVAAFDRREVFVNLGAADGYYAIGMLLADRADRAICFEMSAAGRREILRNASLNGVADRVQILGLADPGFIDALAVGDMRRTTLLIDIEGGEFTLLSDRMLERLEGAQIIFEAHEGQDLPGSVALTELLRRAGRHHAVTELTTGARDLSSFPELRSLSDSDRWLICSEGRRHLMRWYALKERS